MPRQLTYLQARLLLLLLGVGVALGQAVAANTRGTAPTEVLAPVLYIPVFVGAIFWSLAGGLAAAALSSLVYGVLLADQSALVGLGEFASLLVARIGLYVLFGVVVALGVRYIEARLRKLEIYDQIDDLTGLYNTSFFLQDVDLEAGRADRYQTFFSVVGVDIEREAFAGMSRRRYRRIVKDFATRVEASVRQVDRAARIDFPERDSFLVILPQTAAAGAGIFIDRLRAAATDFFISRGCPVDGTLSASALTYPDEPQALARLRDEVAVAEAGRRVVDGSG